MLYYPTKLAYRYQVPSSAILSIHKGGCKKKYQSLIMCNPPAKYYFDKYINLSISIQLNSHHQKLNQVSVA